MLLENITETSNNFIDISINIADSGNINGIGATVKIYKPGNSGNIDALLGMKVISVSNGFSSGSEAIAHFGVADYNYVDIVVFMPCDGDIIKESNVPVNQLYTIR